jgi:chromosomal replication initiator protein
VPDPIVEIIAQSVQQNVRELEGAQNRVLAYAQLNQLPLTVETARKALADLTIRQAAPALDDILRGVAQHYGLDLAELSGRGRSAGVAEPRQVAMYLMREETDASFQAIGAAIGGRDHTTVLHGWEKISRLTEQDPNLRRDILRIREQLYSD